MESSGFYVAEMEYPSVDQPEIIASLSELALLHVIWIGSGSLQAAGLIYP